MENELKTMSENEIRALQDSLEAEMATADPSAVLTRLKTLLPAFFDVMVAAAQTREDLLQRAVINNVGRRLVPVSFMVWNDLDGSLLGLRSALEESEKPKPEAEPASYASPGFYT